MNELIIDNEVQLEPYRFDFHSHLNGILPVESNFYHKITQTEGERKTTTENQQLSMLGFVNSNLTEQNKATETRKAHIALFTYAVAYLAKKNDLRIHENSAKPIRGECAAENVYMACIIINAKANLGLGCVPSQSFYKGVESYLASFANNENELPEKLYALIRYSNHKIYSANKYTPFDDCYELRSAATDQGNKDLWVKMTLDFQTQQGIDHSQIATSINSVENQAELFFEFNNENKTQHMLLVQTANGYNTTEELKEDLEKIKKKLHSNWGGKGNKIVIGLDVLGQETGIIDHATVLKSAQEIAKEKTDFLRKLTVHIHAGEGCGSAPHNRSLAGYWFCHAHQAEQHGAEFYSAFADYILNAYHNTCAHQARHDALANRWNEYTKNHQSSAEIDKKLSNFFDEVFYHKSLTVRGITCRRYDLSSATTRALVAYSAKRNIIALAEHLVDAGDQYSGLAIRAGHALHYRNYLLQRAVPEQAKNTLQLNCDTNLGSNFITGASTLFPDIESYRFNKGLRKLDGVFDYEYMDKLKAALLGQISAEKLQKVREAPKQSENNDEDLKALARSLLIGADGQGMEHTDIQIEAMRQAILLSLIAFETPPPANPETEKEKEKANVTTTSNGNNEDKSDSQDTEEQTLSTPTAPPQKINSGSKEPKETFKESLTEMSSLLNKIGENYWTTTVQALSDKSDDRKNTIETLYINPTSSGAGTVKAKPFHGKIYRQN